MPSPFPGMDPYLEHPFTFPGLHGRLIVGIGAALQPALPDPYFAEIEERVWVEVSQRFIEPDASVFRREVPSGGPVAATLTRSRPVVVTVPHDERHENWIEIRLRGDEGERLITAIEVLSPSNKTPGENARDLYLRKQRELLDSRAHLVEIDLLRAGLHTTAVPLDRLSEAVGPFDYHVSVHRSDRFEDYFVYPFRLAEGLPEIAIPLLPGDGEVALDLQAVFDRAYDTGPYRRRIRYAEAEPVPPLRPEDREWAAGLIRER